MMILFVNYTLINLEKKKPKLLRMLFQQSQRDEMRFLTRMMAVRLSSTFRINQVIM